MRSAIREGIDGLGPRHAPTRPIRRHGGLLDLLLVVGICLLAGTRTPAGALVGYAVETLRGHDSEMPTLTAWFDSGAAAPPDLELLEFAGQGQIPEGGLPEPWRSAARTALADPPPLVRATLDSRDDLPSEDRILHVLDELYTDDPEAALELLAIGHELRDRAIGRARAAGEVDPTRYQAHRRYLPVAAARDADRVVHGTMALATALDLQWPVRIAHSVSSPFGYRIHPTLKTRRFHNGIDLAVAVGTPIHSPQAGRVVTVGENATSGRFVTVDHGHGLRTTYCHLSRALVRRGESVQRGQLLADSGNTGRSTGPHLHWIVKIAGKAVDPARFAPATPAS